MTIYKDIIEFIDINIIYCLIPTILTLMLLNKIYHDKIEAKKRWVEQYFKLPNRVQNRLVIENCENYV